MGLAQRPIQRGPGMGGGRMAPALLAIVACLLMPFPGFAAEGWEQVREILKRIQPPQFPGRDFSVTDFGAVGDGRTNCTRAFSRAIEAAAEEGGARVLVPKGIYFTGPIHLKSNVNLHVVEGATIKFSTRPEDYLPPVYSRWEGIECMMYSPLIYAYGQENIAVTGRGVLDGQSSDENWWRFSRLQKEDRARLGRYGDEGVPVEQRAFGRGSKLRPLMIQFYRCRNVLIEGLTIKDSPFWHIHPVLCQNVTIKDVTVTGMGPNNDGCDPESSRDVLISGCHFDTGDDCIAIKSGRNHDGRRVGVPSENIVVRNCVMKNGHGGVVMGSEMTGGIRNVFVEDCAMDSPNLDRAIRIKTNAVRGGFVENVFVRRITIGQVAEAVLKVNFRYEEGDHGPYTPVVRNIQLEGITGRQCGRVLYLDGYDRSPITGVALRNCTFQSVAQPDFIRGVKNLVLENVRINGDILDDTINDPPPTPGN